ncbi:hypothetical protein [Burkholderia pseudomallei]|uniref:hypothetical protein n=1 Tax=Burkholderia pseudomallei TaxID=28450 RepID=UPI001E47AF65|nr:hypothetical protein [Burkholderia pseudomallei]
MQGQLIASIERYVEQYNQHKRPFVWTATADSTLQKVARLFLGQSTSWRPIYVTKSNEGE